MCVYTYRPQLHATSPALTPRPTSSGASKTASLNRNGNAQFQEGCENSPSALEMPPAPNPFRAIFPPASEAQNRHFPLRHRLSPRVDVVPQAGPCDSTPRALLSSRRSRPHSQAVSRSWESCYQPPTWQNQSQGPNPPCQDKSGQIGNPRPARVTGRSLPFVHPVPSVKDWLLFQGYSREKTKCRFSTSSLCPARQSHSGGVWELPQGSDCPVQEGAISLTCPFTLHGPSTASLCGLLSPATHRAPDSGILLD